MLTFALGRRLAFWLLVPLAIPQALWLRRTAPRFDGAAGPTEGVVGSGEPVRLLALGDSVIAGVGAETVAEALPGQVAAALAERAQRQVQWLALGKIGADAAKIRGRVPSDLPADEFDAIVLSVGVNDVTGLHRTHIWSKDLGALLNALRDHSPNALIVMVDVPDLSKFPLLPRPLSQALGIRARTFSSVAELETSGRKACVYARTRFDYSPEQFCADGFHPSTSSYREWGDSLAKLMEPHFRKDRRIELSGVAHPVIE